jgi:hypothetical protein
MNFKILTLSIIFALAWSADHNATITCTNGAGKVSNETFTCYPNGWGISTSTAKWEEAGCPKEKLAAGLAFYSHVFGNTQNDTLSSGIWDTCSWCYSLPSVPAVIQYFAIKS